MCRLFSEELLKVRHISELNNSYSSCFVDLQTSEDDFFDLVRKVMPDFRLRDRDGEALLELLLSSACRKGRLAMQ